MQECALFSENVYILISRRYQLHLACAIKNTQVAIQMHTTTKIRIIEIENPLYGDKFLVAATLTLPRQHQRNPTSPKTMPPRREHCTSAIVT
jgi:hypothetical protein